MLNEDRKEDLTLKRIRWRWKQIKDDCEWKTIKEFAKWDKENYIKKAMLLKRDSSKPHGPNNSYYGGTSVKAEDFMRDAEEWNKKHPIKDVSRLLKALAMKGRNRFARVDIRTVVNSEK